VTPASELVYHLIDLYAGHRYGVAHLERRAELGTYDVGGKPPHMRAARRTADQRIEPRAPLTAVDVYRLLTEHEPNFLQAFGKDAEMREDFRRGMFSISLRAAISDAISSSCKKCSERCMPNSARCVSDIE